MKASDSAFALIRQFEGCKLEAYLDANQVATIGYGHTHGVVMGMTCTQEEAEAWLKVDASWAEGCVNLQVQRASLTQNQFDALVSFVFNVGPEAFRESVLLQLINSGDFANAANQFLRWVHAGKQVLPGLVRRRTAEKNLFQKQQQQ